MAFAPFRPEDGSEPSDAKRDASVRLSDAAQMPADKPDQTADAALEGALADVVANGTQDEIERLTSRIGAAQAGYAGPNGEASALPFPAKQNVAAQSGEQGLLGLREWGEARTVVAAELAEIQSQPGEEQKLGEGTHWHPATQQDAEPYQPEQNEPKQPAQQEALEPVPTVTPETKAVAALPGPESLVAESLVAESLVAEPLAAEPVVAEPMLVEPLASETLVPEPPVAEALISEPQQSEPPVEVVVEAAEPELPLPAPADVQSELADATPELPLAEPTLAELTAEPARPQSLHDRLEASNVEEPSSEPARPQSLSARLGRPLPEPSLPEASHPQLYSEAAVAPITSALDAATKLVADADAAAAALENLSRMLQAHQRPASIVPSPGQQAALRPSHPSARSGMQDQRPMPMPPRSVMPDGDPLQMASPRPEHRPVQRIMRPAPAVEVPAAPRPMRAPTLRPTTAPRDTRQFDLRGFMAGFAIAGALGALLYIYLLSG